MEKREISSTWWECMLIQPLWRTVWIFLKKLKIELPYDPAIPLLGIYPEKTIIQKDTCSPIFIAALFTVARTWNQPKCPLIDEWIKKMWCIHIMEYFWVIKRSETGSFVDMWMDVGFVIQTEVRKWKTNGNAYMWNLEKWYRWTYFQGRNRDPDIEYGYVDLGGVYLQYSTRSSAQHSVVTQTGWMRGCGWEV